MKTYFIKLVFLILSIFFISCQQASETEEARSITQTTMAKSLRHIVLFKFNEASSQEDIDHVAREFALLPSKIKEVTDFEWGTNNSPEGLDKGFTHSFFVTFSSEADRQVYLKHPDHLAFLEILKPHLEDVLVIDYWTN